MDRRYGESFVSDWGTQSTGSGTWDALELHIRSNVYAVSGAHIGVHVADDLPGQTSDDLAP